MSIETLPFENVIVKAEKFDNEDPNQQCTEGLDNFDEHADPLHDFPVDIEELKVEVPEDSAVPENLADVPNSIKKEVEEECTIKTEPPSSPVEDTVQADSDSRKGTGKKHLVKRKWKRPRSQRIKKDWYPKNLSCDVCSAKFAFKSGLARHVVTHTDDRPFDCTICSQTFRYLDNLNRHMRQHTEGNLENRYVCDVCSEDFSSSYKLRGHKVSHRPPKPFKCNICKSRYHTENGLKHHMRIHTHRKPFTCETCLKTFDKRCHLVHHIKIHTGDKPFACEYCPKKYRLKNSWECHMRTHSKEYRLTCQKCSWKFRSKAEVTKHMKIHTGKDLFSCDVCSVGFRLKRSLTIHKKIHENKQSELSDSRFSKIYCQNNFSDVAPSVKQEDAESCNTLIENRGCG